MPASPHPLPTLFLSHGAPSDALDPGIAGALLEAVGRALPRPDAVLVVSPHWMTPQPRVATTPRPATVHDFSGFAPELYALQYPAAGHPQLAQAAVELLSAAGWAAQPDFDQGLDHGAWVPLRFLFPQADVPVFQLSLPQQLDGPSALALGTALTPLRSQGVLVVGSGSLTHNLYEFRRGALEEERYVREFVAWVRQAVQAGDMHRLASTLSDAPHARRAHPSAEHFLPLLVAAGAAGSTRPATVLDGRTRHGVLSMESYVFGADLSAAVAPVTAAHAYDPA